MAENDISSLVAMLTAYPPYPVFEVGQRVYFDTRVTGGSHLAIIMAAQWSTFFECWQYDVRITGRQSRLYPQGHVEYAVYESALRAR